MKNLILFLLLLSSLGTFAAVVVGENGDVPGNDPLVSSEMHHQGVALIDQTLRNFPPYPRQAAFFNTLQEAELSIPVEQLALWQTPIFMNFWWDAKVRAGLVSFFINDFGFPAYIVRVDNNPYIDIEMINQLSTNFVDQIFGHYHSVIRKEARHISSFIPPYGAMFLRNYQYIIFAPLALKPPQIPEVPSAKSAVPSIEVSIDQGTNVPPSFAPVYRKPPTVLDWQSILKRGAEGEISKPYKKRKFESEHSDQTNEIDSSDGGRKYEDSLADNVADVDYPPPSSDPIIETNSNNTDGLHSNMVAQSDSLITNYGNRYVQIQFDDTYFYGLFKSTKNSNSFRLSNSALIFNTTKNPVKELSVQEMFDAPNFPTGGSEIIYKAPIFPPDSVTSPVTLDKIPSNVEIKKWIYSDSAIENVWWREKVQQQKVLYYVDDIGMTHWIVKLDTSSDSQQDLTFAENCGQNFNTDIIKWFWDAESNNTPIYEGRLLENGLFLFAPGSRRIATNTNMPTSGVGNPYLASPPRVLPLFTGQQVYPRTSDSPPIDDQMLTAPPQRLYLRIPHTPQSTSPPATNQVYTIPPPTLVMPKDGSLQ